MQEEAWFDLATSGEVDLVRGLGVAPERCIHTHPIKRDRDIHDALDFGVTTFVVDNPDELRKFAKYVDQAELLLRVSFRSPDAKVDLSKKFGCTPEAARDLGVRIKGLSFHVGSQAADPRGAGTDPGRGPPHRRARPLHLGPGDHRCIVRHGQGPARRPLVVLPG